MSRLDDVPVEDLRAALDEVEEKRPVKRLMVAIAYKHGVTQTDLADWYGVERKTIYNWLTRFDTADGVEAIVDAARDDVRPGRPRKLSDQQIADVVNTLHRPPTEAGYDASTWTSALLERYIEETFGIEYAQSSCRRLLAEVDTDFR